MYDLHCHILPNIDDGARDLSTALEMARIAVDDGITHLVCTPHIYPGLFDNNPEGIAAAVQSFCGELEALGIDLELAPGADIQVVPELVENLRSGMFPTLNQSRYFLFEPPHHLPLVNFDRFVLDALGAGFVPVITHPERLGWIKSHYQEFVAAAQAGAWIQLTAGSLTGRFGKAAKYWGEKMLGDGIVHLLATDGHNCNSRPPLLAEGELIAQKHVGKEEAARMVLDRPRAVWKNADPEKTAKPPGLNQAGEISGRKEQNFFQRLFS
ncbi:tyrosine-protein phosphatase [Thiolapillus sp.]